jgi:dihydrofolate synthase/folylpolyglutamate synthase
VALDHMDVLGDTREQIAAEKLAVIRPGATVVLGEPEWEPLARSEGAGAVVVAARSNLALATAAAESFLGRPVDPHVAEAVALPGRLERRGEAPLEIWDGAHNMAGIGWLLPRLPDRRYVVVASILEDKRPELMLEALSVLGDHFVATQSSNGRALGVSRLAGTEGAVLVTGSLYLLADLYKEENVRWRTSATG